MAILWHEMWHEALEEASRQYFGESNVEAMLTTLMPLHEMMQANGGITLKEIAFVKVPVPLLPCCPLPFSQGCHALWLRSRSWHVSTCRGIVNRMLHL